MSGSSDRVTYWDGRYQRGGYEGEPPVPFVDEIAETVKQELGADARGLYVGCGDGRNFVPLVDAGLEITGIDLSGIAIKNLRTKRPDLRKRTQVIEFEDFEAPSPFDFAVALQVFQHGNEHLVKGHFERTRAILRTGGLFFLRVNSASTRIIEPHKKHAPNEHGGVSVHYTGAHKRNMYIHFFTDSELAALAEQNDFEVVTGFAERTMTREDETTWSQWESTWRAT